MAQEIIVYVDVSESSSKFIFDMSDLNVTQEEWDAMSEADRKSLLQEMCDDESNQPYWVVENWKQK